MSIPLSFSLATWSASLLFMMRQLWIARAGYEDARGFHPAEAPLSRWRHVRLQHCPRSHREPRHAHR